MKFKNLKFEKTIKVFFSIKIKNGLAFGDVIKECFCRFLSVKWPFLLHLSEGNSYVYIKFKKLNEKIENRKKSLTTKKMK